MALVVPNSAEDIMLQNILNITAPQTPILRLYTNNFTPGEFDVEGDYNEASGFGYASVSLTPGSWTILEDSVGGPTLASYPQITFTFTGNLGNVYGYFVTQSDSVGALMWAERFSDGPYNIVNNGDQVKVSVRITLE